MGRGIASPFFLLYGNNSFNYMVLSMILVLFRV